MKRFKFFHLFVTQFFKCEKFTSRSLALPYTKIGKYSRWNFIFVTGKNSEWVCRNCGNWGEMVKLFHHYYWNCEIVDRNIARKSFDCTRHLRKETFNCFITLYMALLRCLWTVFSSKHKTSIRNALNWPPILEHTRDFFFGAKWILCNLTSSWIAAFVVNLCELSQRKTFQIFPSNRSAQLSKKNFSNSISFLSHSAAT